MALPSATLLAQAILAGLFTGALYGLLFGCLAMLILHNLIRYAYPRSRSSLWLAVCEGLLSLSLLLLLNLAGPWRRLPFFEALPAAEGEQLPRQRFPARSRRQDRFQLSGADHRVRQPGEGRGVVARERLGCLPLRRFAPVGFSGPG